MIKMSKDPRIETITGLAGPLAASMKLALWGVELASGARSVLRVFVEGLDQDVTIDQCAKVSRLLGMALDVEEIFDGPYTLEVSSPGLERTFFTREQLALGLGKHVEINLTEPLAGLPGRKKIWGKLVAAGGDDFVMEVHEAAGPGEPDPLLPFAWSQVKKARQKHFLPEEGKAGPGKGKKTAPRKAAKKEKTAAIKDTEAEE